MEHGGHVPRDSHIIPSQTGKGAASTERTGRGAPSQGPRQGTAAPERLGPGCRPSLQRRRPRGLEPEDYRGCAGVVMGIAQGPHQHDG